MTLTVEYSEMTATNVCCSLSAVFLLDSVKVDNKDMVVHTLSLPAPDVWQSTLNFYFVREPAVLFVHRIFEYSFV